MQEKPEGSSLGWFGRVLRAVMIGAAIYYTWAFAVTYMMRQTISNSGQLQAERQEIDTKPWTGTRPPNEADLAVQMGYDWASTHDVRNHAVCRKQWTVENHDSLVRSGCSKYVTEQNVVKLLKPIPRHDGWDDGTTTAECIAEVHAYWDPILKDMRENEDYHVASTRMARDVAPAIRQCDNFDNIRIGRVIHQPQVRINDILEKIANAQVLTQQDIDAVRNDYPGVWFFPENEYRTQYLNSAETFFRIVGGRDKVLTAADEAALQAPPRRP